MFPATFQLPGSNWLTLQELPLRKNEECSIPWCSLLSACAALTCGPYGWNFSPFNEIWHYPMVNKELRPRSNLDLRYAQFRCHLALAFGPSFWSSLSYESQPKFYACKRAKSQQVSSQLDFTRHQQRLRNRMDFRTGIWRRATINEKKDLSKWFEMIYLKSLFSWLTEVRTLTRIGHQPYETESEFPIIKALVSITRKWISFLTLRWWKKVVWWISHNGDGGETHETYLLTCIRSRILRAGKRLYFSAPLFNIRNILSWVIRMPRAVRNAALEGANDTSRHVSRRRGNSLSLLMPELWYRD